MTPAEAASLIDRAVDAEYDPDLIQLYKAISGQGELLAIPTDELGSLEERLRLFATPETLLAMGQAWIDADLLADAIAYVRHARLKVEGWLRSDLELTKLSSCDHLVQREIADVWTESCNKHAIYRRPVGFREPPPPKCTIPPPERDGDRDHRKTTRTLAECTRTGKTGDFQTYRTRVGREPQVTRKDEVEWEREFDGRLRRMKQSKAWRGECRDRTRGMRDALERSLDKGEPQPQAPLPIIDIGLTSLESDEKRVTLANDLQAGGV